MSADSYHHSVEQSLQKKRKVYDFDYFVDAVQKAVKKSDVKIMEVSDFYAYLDCSSQYKLNKKSTKIYLRDIAVVVAKRGNYSLDVKMNHDHGNVFEALDFLRTKIFNSKTFPDVIQKTTPRGVKLTYNKTSNN